MPTEATPATTPARPTAAPMTRPTAASPEALASWLRGQRWFAQSATTGPVSLTSTALPTSPPLAVALADAGGADRYQLIVPVDDGASRPDVADDPDSAQALASWIATDHASASGGAGSITGRWLDGATPLGDGPTRALRGEQSNTSMVIGGTHVLKVFRRLQAGSHPEIDIGRHLVAVAADGVEAPVARLSGWYELRPADDPDTSTALGVVQELVPGALDAWGLVLSGLAGDAGGLLSSIHDLGIAVAALHVALAQPAGPVRSGSKPSPTADPSAPQAFGATPLPGKRLDEIVAAIRSDADRLFASTFERPEPVAALAGRGADVARLAERLAAELGTDLGAAIRHHGDLHLGQVVLGDEGWVILDFEGEPSRPLAERRRRHSPLRDVAGMLRSFAYAAATHRRSGAGPLSAGWEPAARAAFLDGYLATVEPALLPASAATTSGLLTLFELEKVLYEIGYELSHRPDWVDLPVGGLRRLLEGDRR